MLPNESDYLLVGLPHAEAGGQVAVAGVTVEVRPVGRRLVHGRLRRQPARPLARRPLALVPRVTGGQAGPLRCPRHQPRRIGRVAA